MALEVDIEKRLGAFHLRAAFCCDRETLGILGPSGSGKSLTLKCIAGIERPDRGHIALDGQVLFDSQRKIDLPPQKRRVGYLFQSYALFPGMTVRQNLLCALHAERDRKARAARVDAMLKLLQLRDAADLRPEALSGGQAQRTALGRILLNAPDLMMLDEPFSALDAHLRLRLQMEMKDLLAGFGRGVLLVTHDRDEAYRLCDRLGVMSAGRMTTVKDTKALFADPETRAAAALTGCKNIADAVKTGPREVFVPAWNARLITQAPVRDGLVAVGIRAHSFKPDEALNRFPVRILKEMEEPFAWVSAFRFEGQAPDAPALWWRYPRECRPTETPEALGVAPGEVLLLY